MLPQQLNPYAIGHLINHPPPDTPPNACLIDFEIPESFFPSFLLAHLPYMIKSTRFNEPPGVYHAVGVVALSQLDNEEIFINYGNERFLDYFTPEWLSEPPDNQPIADYLCKENCLYEFSRLTRFLLKWDKMSLSETEKIQKNLEENAKKRKQEALDDPRLFEKYYNKN